MLRELLLKYQTYDPAGGSFTLARSRRQYALLLGLSPAHLGNVLNGKRAGGVKVLVALVQAFPVVAGELQSPGLRVVDEGAQDGCVGQPAPDPV